MFQRTPATCASTLVSLVNIYQPSCSCCLTPCFSSLVFFFFFHLLFSRLLSVCILGRCCIRGADSLFYSSLRNTFKFLQPLILPRIKSPFSENRVTSITCSKQGNTNEKLKVTRQTFCSHCHFSLSLSACVNIHMMASFLFFFQQAFTVIQHSAQVTGQASLLNVGLWWYTVTYLMCKYTYSMLSGQYWLASQLLQRRLVNEE